MLDQLLYNSETNECNCFNEPQAMSGEYWSGVSHRLPKITFNIYVRVEHTFASTYDIDTHLGDRPPMLTQQRQVCFKQKASRKQTSTDLCKSNLSTIPAEGRRMLNLNN